MDGTAKLKEIVANIAGVDAGTLDGAFSLAGKAFGSSLRKAALAAAITRHLGVTTPAIFTARTFAELETVVFGQASSAPAEAPAPPAGPVEVPAAGATGVGCGIDVELVDSLPDVPDFWEEPFYQENFTRAELAHCLLQAQPRLHLAARWCAKEALKKCDPAFLNLRMDEIEVWNDVAGAPLLGVRRAGGFQRLPVALSLTHTDTLAAATVVRLAAPAGE